MLSDFAYVYICASALQIIFTNPRRMRCRIIVVVWPVCLSVCLSVCLCVTANLEASNDGYQWHQRDMAIIKKKGVFSKDASFKCCVIYILRQCQRPHCVFTSTVASPYAKEAKEMLSSTRSIIIGVKFNN